MKARFSGIEFDSETGELTWLERSDELPHCRLAPQPAQLLGLMIRQYPGLITHEMIREVLWPETIVDYGSLHFCVRQIRSALNDSATEPKFVETIPRRGYRWIVEPVFVKPGLGSHEADPESPHRADIAEDKQLAASRAAPHRLPATPSHRIAKQTANPTGNRSIRHAVWRIGLVLVLALSVGGLYWIYQAIGGSGPRLQPGMTTASVKPRIAIMPFGTDNPEFSVIETETIALGVMERLDVDQSEIVGPTTTVRYDGRPQKLRELGADYHIEWIVNGKFYLEEGVPVVLGEIIRSSDGAHVWVKRFNTQTPVEQICNEIADAIMTTALRQK